MGSRQQTLRRANAEETVAGKVVLFPISIAVSIWQCWIGQKLWRWFVLPTFGVKVPNVATIYGLSVLIALLWPFTDSDKPVTERVAFQITLALMAWLTGWIAHGIAG